MIELAERMTSAHHEGDRAGGIDQAELDTLQGIHMDKPNSFPDQNMYVEFLRSYQSNINKLLSVKNYSFHKALHDLALHGMGILNYQDSFISGERYLVKTALNNIENPVVIDIGANVGGYARLVKETSESCDLHSFEPHPVTFTSLKKVSDELGFNAYNMGFSDCEGVTPIYDYADENGSSHASLYKDVIEKNFKRKSLATEVQLKTLDSFLDEKEISSVSLLKIDTEGHEVKVLHGAQDAIRRGAFEVVQIEFNEMNVYSRTFLKDIVDMFPSHYFFRMLPDGLAPLGQYSPLSHEVFAFQNIAIIAKNSRILSGVNVT